METPHPHYEVTLAAMSPPHLQFHNNVGAWKDVVLVVV